MHRWILLFTLFVPLLMTMSGLTLAGNQQQINQILAEQNPPFGVVFEIVEGNGDALQWAIPAVNGYVKQLRERFPDIGLAVVSHGREQFGLMKSKRQQNPKVHKDVQSLVASDVPVHVCGTYASWQGKTAGDFDNLHYPIDHATVFHL